MKTNKSKWKVKFIKALVPLFAVLIIVSCKGDSISYDHLYYSGDGTKILSENVLKKHSQKLEDGYRKITDYDGRIVEMGQFDNGFRIGLWNYFPSDSLKVELIWEKFSGERVTVNFLDNWEPLKGDNAIFQARLLESNSQYPNNKYFVVLDKSEDHKTGDLIEYWKSLTKTVFKLDSVREYAIFEFRTKTGRYFFSRYVVSRNGEELLLLNFLGNLKGSKVIDITLSSLNVETEKKHISFFNALRSLWIDSERFFSPFQKIISVEEIIPDFIPEGSKL